MSKHTIEVDLPDGWRPVGYRVPGNGEHYINSTGGVQEACAGFTSPWLIVEPEWQWPEWLTAPWIAMDKNEKWHAYDREPSFKEDELFWFAAGCRYMSIRTLFLAFTPPPCTDWRESKRRNPRLA